MSILFKGVNVAIHKSNNLAAEGRDNLAKALYSRLFSWLVMKVNSCLKERDEEQSQVNKRIIDHPNNKVVQNIFNYIMGSQIRAVVF